MAGRLTQAANSLQRPDHAQLYNTMDSTWPRGSRIRIFVQGYQRPLKVPLAFLEKCGSNTNHFLQELVQHTVNEPGRLRDYEENDVDLDAVPTASLDLLFQPTEPGIHFTWASGPDGRHQGLSPGPEDPFDDSASLAASQMSALQGELRERLLIRDGRCVITNASYTVSQAAHLAPKHRDDIYQTVLGDDYRDPPYNASYALFLQTDMHRAYNRFQWSLYAQGDDLVVHVLHGHASILGYHGKIIRPGRFRTDSEEDIEGPDKRLLAWHYRHCVLKVLRGFSRPASQ